MDNIANNISILKMIDLLQDIYLQGYDFIDVIVEHNLLVNFRISKINEKIPDKKERKLSSSLTKVKALL